MKALRMLYGFLKGMTFILLVTAASCIMLWALVRFVERVLGVSGG